MRNTILITGASSGIGKATARFFQGKGWNVIATMRAPDREAELTKLERTLVVRLDVTDEESILSAVNSGIERFGRIDVLLNNAGYGAYGPLEAFPMESIERQFNTNVIGLLAVTKAVLPHFRENKSGFLVNVSSAVGRVTFPVGTLYQGAKFAVEGISESLFYELEPIGVKVKIIEPGVISTDFSGRSFDFTNDESLAEYQNTAQKFMETFHRLQRESASPAESVAQTIWESVTDGTDTLRYISGKDAEELIAMRSNLDDREYLTAIKQAVGL